MTRTRTLTASLLAAWLAAAVPQQASASALDFEIVNRTNQPIVGLWASPSDSTSWGRLFRNTFVPEGGGRQRVEFNGSGQGCVYDLRVQFSEGGTYSWRNVNLCRTLGVQIFVSGGEVRASTW